MQDATVAPTQSAPQVSQTQPTSYVAPAAQSAAQAPAVGTTPQWVATSQPMAAPAPQAQAQMGIAAPQYSPTPSSYQESQVSQPQDNPYKEAFNKVVGLLSSPVQFPFQGQQSSQTPAAGQANYASQQTTPYNNAVQPTSMPGTVSNQGYSNASSQTSTGITQEQLAANGVSEASLQVIDHFGADAPAVLNDYACKIEDALIKTDSQLKQGVGLLKQLNTEHKAYTKILTDPNVLADYTTKFFGPNGPHPVTPKAPAQAQGQTVGQQFQAQAPAAPAQAQRQPQAAAPQRPEMPVPPQPQAAATPGDFWNNFGTAADRDPQNAWKYLNAAQQNPEVFRQKLLVME
jgi:hypothetical protein